AKRVYKRLRNGAIAPGVRPRKRPRTAVRRARPKYHSNLANPSASAMVKCVDRPIRDTKLSPAAQRFANRVLSATMPEFAKRTFIQELSIYGAVGSQDRAVRSSAVVGWSQIAFDLLSNLTPNKYRSSVYFPDQPLTGNPTCLLSNTFSSGASGNQMIPNSFNTVQTRMEGMGVTPVRTAKFMQQSRHMQLELRNPTNTGMRLQITTCRHRGKMPNNSVGATLPGIYANSDFSYTPLECLGAGMVARGVSTRDLGGSRHLGLKDSPIYNDHWQSLRVCEV
ncbi:MAG: hypothetical protein ACT6RL_22285, partial [Neoaquamicrobium sediminum]|uniref:hypothetical protein n=1 Tax=Neoaquamicrobium sediminum TaxID=1849104 RepID=UPI0040384145